MPADPRPTNDDRIRAALWFAERGFGVFPVWSTKADGVCRCVKGRDCESPGKHPIGVHGFHDATTDPARISTFLSAASEPNYGLLPPDGVFILDVDGAGLDVLNALQDRLGWLPATLRTKTANGWHVFLRWPSGHPRPIGQLWGFVTRWREGTGAGYVIGPRSVHASGHAYAPGDTFEIATLPEAWAVDAVGEAKPDGPLTIEISGGYDLPEPGYTGSRYAAIVRYVASRYMRGVTKDEIRAGVLTVLAPRFAEPLSEPELVTRFERAWKGTPERLGEPMYAESPRKVDGRAGIDAADLLALDLPPLRWIVPDLLPEGTAVIAAAPKIGKSWLVYQIAIEAALGGELLGRRVTPGSVLYYALEDGQRRGQDRLRTVLAGRTMPAGRLEVRWNANTIGHGLEDDIAAWLDEHQDAAMVAIDTLGKVKPDGDARKSAYDVDVKNLTRLQDLFRDRNVALVIVHHVRKDATEDFLSSVSGTHGLTGSVDTTIRIDRKRQEAFGHIDATGRDIEDVRLSVRFEGGLWTEAPESLPDGSFQRREVYLTIEAEGPLWPKAIADRLGLIRQSVDLMCQKLAASGAVVKTAKGYMVPGVEIALTTPTAAIAPPAITATGGSVTRARAREPYWDTDREGA